MADLLGASVKDIITGFSGVVVGQVRYLTGCDQALVVPKIKKDGSIAHGEWFDVQRLQVLSKTVVKLDNSATPGPDRAPTRSY